MTNVPTVRHWGKATSEPDTMTGMTTDRSKSTFLNKRQSVPSVRHWGQGDERTGHNDRHDHRGKSNFLSKWQDVPSVRRRGKVTSKPDTMTGMTTEANRISWINDRAYHSSDTSSVRHRLRPSTRFRGFVGDGLHQRQTIWDASGLPSPGLEWFTCSKVVFVSLSSEVMAYISNLLPILRLDFVTYSKAGFCYLF